MKWVIMVLMLVLPAIVSAQLTLQEAEAFDSRFDKIEQGLIKLDKTITASGISVKNVKQEIKKDVLKCYVSGILAVWGLATGGTYPLVAGMVFAGYSYFTLDNIVEDTIQ